MDHGANVLDMEAESSQILPDELAEVLAAFERATGLYACFRPMSDRWRGTDGAIVTREPFVGHRSPFCVDAKARSMAACTKCDNADLPGACSPSNGRLVEPFVRTCHAGADEILLPVWDQGVLVAVLFVGQFTRDGAHGLRQLDATQIQHVRMLMLALRSYLEDLLRRLEGQRQEFATGRRGAIEAYVRERLAAGPTLQELASRLSLSRSRTSHVVREVTGRSFQDLVEERRIGVAKDLLTETDGTIAWVARQTGFNDVAYFCRYFKRKTGTTPTGFRRRYRRVPSV
jgi:AraC-like DNA-binding protein